MIAEYSAQGTVAQVRRLSLAPRARQGGGLRGRIVGFSRASRKRLVDLMARMDVSRCRVVFMTLTFSGTPTSDDATAAFKRFLSRMRRWFPEAAAIWRKERQSRGSYHYHLLWFHLPYIPQYWLQDTWTACTQEVLSIIDVRLVRSRRHAMAYVSKYIGKMDAPPVSPSLEDASYQHVADVQAEGRAWGVVNREALPMGELLSVLVDDEEMTRYFFRSVDTLSHGRAGRSDQKAALYSEDAYRMVAWAAGQARSAGVAVQRLLYELVRWRTLNSLPVAEGLPVNQ